MDRRHLGELEDLLADLLGPSEPMARGFYFYGQGKKFGCGALLLVDEGGTAAHGEHAAVCVELKGSSIAQVGQLATWQLWQWAHTRGARCTRIDLRLDFFDRPGLVDRVHRSCLDGHLRGAKLFNPIAPRRASGELVGHSVELGRRGKEGSGRFVRVYDKGLQTGDAEAGEWERWECEFSQEAASIVAVEWVEKVEQLMQEHGGDVQQVMQEAAVWIASRTLGAVDFREGGRLDRSTRVSWWASLLGGLQVVPTVVRRAASTLAGFARHVRRSVAPSIAAMARATGQTVGQVFEQLLAGQEVKASPPGKPSVVEFAASCGAVVLDRADRWRSWLLAVTSPPGQLFQPLPVAAGHVFRER